MTLKLSSVIANLEKEAKGDWIEYPDWPGVEFNVSSLLLPAYQAARELLYQRLARKYKKQPIPRDVLSAEIGRLYCKHILHGWRGFDVPYSEEAAIETMTDPKYRNVVAAVEFCAARVSDVELEYVEEEMGNLQPHSEAD